MRYVSTRGSAPVLDFEGATLAGLAADGGLYVPEAWPTLTRDEIAALADLEGAKADQLDLLALLEGLGDDIDDGGDSGVSVLFRNFSLSSDFGNQFRLIHYETTSKKYSASRGVAKHRKSPENLGESAISPAKSL